MTKKFTYASAFAGIGGMTLGLKPLGGIGVAAWEYDPTEKRTQYAQEAHRLLHPEIPVHGDICEAKTEEIPDFDVLCFTPPCQGYSHAGKRKGANFICMSCSHEFLPESIAETIHSADCPKCSELAVPKDDRGVLAFEALRIAKAKRPKALFMENVKGLISHEKGDTLSALLRSINEIGYTVDFTVLNSKYFDVAQNRERVYLIGIRDDLITPEPWNDVKGSTMLPKAKRRYQEEGAKTFNFDWPEQTEVRTRLRDFLEDSVDERYYLSEDKTAALVKQLEEKAEGIAVKEATTKGYAVAAEGDAVNIQFPNSKTRRGRVGKQMANTIEASGVNQGVVERVEPIRIGGLYGNKQAGAVWDKDAISPAITTPSGGYSEPIITEEITMQMVGRADILGHDYNKRVYHEDGIGRYLNTASDIGRSLKVATKGEEGSRYRIRKLTPRECARLQSIPEDIIDVLLTHFSDSRVYKFCGNGLTTNVINAIGERLIKYL